ncbi:UNVERIFIED_CONTAM: hypothetical protein GTU68_061694 [Idotea baltica]|nr:hypothetical protein [Idotea baltica]
MARDRNQSDDFVSPVRRLLVGLLVLFMLGTFLIWRIDNPRVERFRMMVIDAVVPSFDWAMAPVTGIVHLLSDFQSYQRLAQQNVDLRRELQDMKSWREAAIQLDQENARLRDLINVQLDPQLTRITGVVMADSGSPFRQSVLLNVGARDGILDGWPAMDGIGLVGRISGVGDVTSRVMLLTDTSSQIAVTIQPSGQRAILSGDNTINPLLQFIEDPDLVKPGDRVVTSGDGGVFPLIYGWPTARGKRRGAPAHASVRQRSGKAWNSCAYCAASRARRIERSRHLIGPDDSRQLMPR